MRRGWKLFWINGTGLGWGRPAPLSFLPIISVTLFKTKWTYTHLPLLIDLGLQPNIELLNELNNSLIWYMHTWWLHTSSWEPNSKEKLSDSPNLLLWWSGKRGDEQKLKRKCKLTSVKAIIFRGNKDGVRGKKNVYLSV